MFQTPSNEPQEVPQCEADVAGYCTGSDDEGDKGVVDLHRPEEHGSLMPCCANACPTSSSTSDCSGQSDHLLAEGGCNFLYTSVHQPADGSLGNLKSQEGQDTVVNICT